MADVPETGDAASSAADRAERFARSPAAAWVLVLLLLAVYVPGMISIPVVDRDEARFAQASRQMFESFALPEQSRDEQAIEPDDSGRLRGGMHAGNWAVPMVGQRPRLAKPPLIYWLQSTSAALLTGFEPLADRIWHYRVPSVASAILACLLTWRLGVRSGHARAGLLAGALLGVCPMVVWDANQARADQLLLATTTAAMAALYAVRHSPRKGWAAPILFWIAMGAGVLTKGPITPMIAGLTVLAFCAIARDWRWLGRTRPLLALVILPAMLAPWVIESVRIVGWDTLVSIWTDETIGRSAEPKEGHWGPPGYHFVLLAVLFWPGSLITLYALGAAVKRAIRQPGDTTRLQRWKSRAVADDTTLFLLCWIIPSWIVFELVGTKLPHYTLPLYPAVALLTARSIIALADTLEHPKGAVPPKAGIIIWLLIGAGLTIAAPIAIARAGGAPTLWIGAGLFGAASLALLIAATRSVRRSLIRTHLLAIAAAVVFCIGLLEWVLPRATALHVTDQLASIIAQAPAGTPVAAAGYTEDSLVFATRGRLASLSPAQIERWAAANPGGVVILPADAPAQPGWTELGRVRGINYSKGERVELVVYRID